MSDDLGTPSQDRGGVSDTMVSRCVHSEHILCLMTDSVESSSLSVVTYPF